MSGLWNIRNAKGEEMETVAGGINIFRYMVKGRTKEGKNKVAEVHTAKAARELASFANQVLKYSDISIEREPVVPCPHCHIIHFEKKCHGAKNVIQSRELIQITRESDTFDTKV